MAAMVAKQIKEKNLKAGKVHKYYIIHIWNLENLKITRTIFDMYCLRLLPPQGDHQFFFGEDLFFRIL